MSTPLDLTRKVRQLDNDVQSIYGMLADISATQRRQGNRLEEISSGLDGVSSRVEGVSSRVEGVSSRVEGVSSRVEGVSSRLDGVSSRLEEVTATQTEQGAKLDTIVELLRRSGPSSS